MVSIFCFFLNGEEQNNLTPTEGKLQGVTRIFSAVILFSLLIHQLSNLKRYAEYNAFLVHQHSKRNNLRPFVVLLFLSHYVLLVCRVLS